MGSRKPTPLQRTRAIATSDRAMRMAAMSESLRPVFAVYGEHLAQSTRLRQDWTRLVGAADEVQGRDREQIVSFMRRLHAVSPVARAFHRSIVGLVVGEGGVYPQGRTPEAEAAARAFWRWAEEQGHADFYRRDGLVGLQRTMVLECLNTGDVLVAMVGSRDDRPMGVALQLLESERLTAALTDKNYNRPGTPRVVDGVELDASGREVAYHVAPYDHIGVRSSTLAQSTPQRIDARFARLFAHRDRAEQTRGLPYLVSAMGRLAALEEYQQAVEVAAKLQACIAIITKTESPEAMANALGGGATTGVAQAGTNGSDDTLSRMVMAAGPGTVFGLGVNEDTKSLGPTQPGATFDQFVGSLIRTVAGAAGIPIEIALGDFSRANFSVSRMALLRAHETAGIIRDSLVRQVLHPVFRWWVDLAIRDGVLRGSLDALTDVRWRGPVMPSPDPSKDVSAVAAKLAQNLTTLRDELDATGLRLEDVLEQRGAEMAHMRRLGVAPPMPAGTAPDATAPTDGGGEQDDQTVDEE